MSSDGGTPKLTADVGLTGKLAHPECSAKKGSVVLEKPHHTLSLPDTEATCTAPTGTGTDRSSGDREAGSTHRRARDAPPETTARDSHVEATRDTAERLALPAVSGLAQQVLAADQGGNGGVLVGGLPYVTSDARLPLFKGRMGLRTMTGSGHVAFPSLPTPC